ncbi:MAG: hypothetical protein JW807_15190 [Spirochaetes bacterium]|nr:hypothetical protein [Spirochaetota bacterium]
MYDRYKSKKKGRSVYKVLLALILIGAASFFGVRYRHHLAFWKYTQTKLEKKIASMRQIKDAARRREALSDLADIYERYKDEHQVDPDAFFTSGEIHFLLGETYLPGNFSELFINDRARDIGKEARDEFLKAMKDIKKGAAIKNGDLDGERSLMLARSGFYTDYHSPTEIFQMIENIGDSIKPDNIENIRFYSVINILNRHEDYGLKHLLKHGMVRDNIQGLLFYATAERTAKKYTGAIVSYKDVLARTSDENIRKLVHVNLGKIYFNRSLYRESIEQFGYALKIDEKDSTPKIWIGKNYSAMGEKDKARAIWSDVLTSDGKNTEVRELLGTM